MIRLSPIRVTYGHRPHLRGDRFAEVLLYRYAVRQVLNRMFLPEKKHNILLSDGYDTQVRIYKLRLSNNWCLHVHESLGDYVFNCRKTLTDGANLNPEN